jgi:hypothetical protein
MWVEVRIRMPIPYPTVAHLEPNHRQEMALERIELAVAELASVLLASCRSHGTSGAAISGIRKAVAPVLADILAEE